VTASPRISLFSTGVLRTALREAACAFTERSGVAVDQTYGNSGKLRERILNGEAVDVFGAGDVDNPQLLHDSGAYGAVTVIAHSPMSLLVKSSIPATRSVVEIMLDPAVRLVTGLLAPPKSDPSGDYAEIIFGRIDARQPGSKAALEAKALQLAGGNVAMPPDSDVPTFLLLTADLGDAFLAYGSNFVAAVAANPDALRALPLPPELAVRADFGLTLRNDAPPEAVRFRDFLTGDQGQAIFVKNGFTRI
jgi:ABC-type molybdate transport system substrate-binding protein